MSDSEVEAAPCPGAILVSACLLGVACRFDGASMTHAAVVELARVGRVVPVCPEQLGGLPTPRPRHERVCGRVVSEHGRDATRQFEHGADQVLVIAKLTNCRQAILKARSPSCGVGRIYDGTFQGRVVVGDGILTERLRAAGIAVRTEEDLPEG